LVAAIADGAHGILDRVTAERRWNGNVSLELIDAARSAA